MDDLNEQIQWELLAFMMEDPSTILAPKPEILLVGGERRSMGRTGFSRGPDAFGSPINHLTTA